MKKFKLISLLVIAVLAVIIFLQNMEPVTFNLLFWRPYASKALAFLVVFLLGLIIGLLIPFLFRRKA